MHAFSYSIKNIISFRRIVLPQRPRTRKTRVEEASPSPPPSSFSPIQLLSASSSVFLLPSPRTPPLLCLPLSLVSSRFSSSYNPVSLSLLDTTRASIFSFSASVPFLATPVASSLSLSRSWFFSLRLFLFGSPSAWGGRGEFSLLSSFLLSSLSLADITRGGNFAIFLGERFIEKLIMQLRNHPSLLSAKEESKVAAMNPTGESRTITRIPRCDHVYTFRITDRICIDFRIFKPLTGLRGTRRQNASASRILFFVGTSGARIDFLEK